MWEVMLVEKQRLVIHPVRHSESLVKAVESCMWVWPGVRLYQLSTEVVVCPVEALWKLGGTKPV
jgi:hypothetical protein